MDSSLSPEGVELSKRIWESFEKFVGKLLGPATEEAGQLMADQVKFRRWKNQVKIFSKAKEFLDKKQIEPKQLDLKILHPLLEYSSLEEDETMQSVWSNVIVNISSYDSEQVLNKKCIEILKDLVPNEILLMNTLYLQFEVEAAQTYVVREESVVMQDYKYIHPSNSVFSPWDYEETLKLSTDQMNLYVDRLVSYGIFKYENPDLEETIDTYNTVTAPTGRVQKIEQRKYYIQTSDRIHFTNFGIHFIKLCKEPTDK